MPRVPRLTQGVYFGRRSASCAWVFRVFAALSIQLACGGIASQPATRGSRTSLRRCRRQPCASAIAGRHASARRDSSPPKACARLLRRAMLRPPRRVSAASRQVPPDPRCAWPSDVLTASLALRAVALGLPAASMAFLVAVGQRQRPRWHSLSCRCRMHAAHRAASRRRQRQPRSGGKRNPSVAILRNQHRASMRHRLNPCAHDVPRGPTRAAPARRIATSQLPQENPHGFSQATLPHGFARLAWRFRGFSTACRAQRFRWPEALFFLSCGKNRRAFCNPRRIRRKPLADGAVEGNRSLCGRKFQFSPWSNSNEEATFV